MKPVSFETHIKQRAREMVMRDDRVACLDFSLVVRCGLNRMQLQEMCRVEMFRQMFIRMDRDKLRVEEKYVEDRYLDLFEKWQRNDRFWQMERELHGDTSVNTAVKGADSNLGCMFVSNFLIVFKHDYETKTFKGMKTYRPVNRRLDFYVYDRHNHCRVLVASAPVVRWTAKSAGIVLYDTLAALPAAWIFTVGKKTNRKNKGNY